MRITSWNLLHGMAIPPSDDPAALLSSAMSALDSDVIGLQEVDYLHERSGKENQLASIAAMMGTTHWAFAPSLISLPESKWGTLQGNEPKIITASTPLDLPGYGIGLVSKIPVLSWHRLELRASRLGKLMKLSLDGKLKRTYIRDHPRSAIAAVLENGWLIVNTHLSFIPIVNYLQLLKVKKWAQELPIQDKSKIIIMGDLNMSLGIFVRGLSWNSLAKQLTFPSWKPQTQIDYILSQKLTSEDVIPVKTPRSGISDHLPLTIDLS